MLELTFAIGSKGKEAPPMETAQSAMDRLMRKQQAEFVPLHDNIWFDTLQQWVGQGMPEPEVDYREHFGFDLRPVGGQINWQAKRGGEQVVEANDEWRIVRNGNGAALKWWKTRSGTPEHVDFHMSSRKVWEEEYKPHLGVDTARARIGDLNALKAEIQHFQQQGKWTCFENLFIWEFLRSSLGDMNMFMALVEDPGWIHDFNRTYTDLFKASLKIMLEEGGIPDGAWICDDLGYRDRLFCSPDILRELIFPYYQEMVAFYHSYNVPVILHSCGYQAPMIPMVIEAGFDALNPMEVKAGNRIFDYAEQYGDKLAFVCGLDARILESGNRETIRRGVREFILGMRGRGARFVYGSDHSLSSNIRYQDFLYSLEVYRELR